jgi:DNA-binding GntR family transcriptional regulator
MVFEGVVLPGDRIRQDDIAIELGVSRIPVREAVIALDREGWVTIEPHRGAFVNGLDPAYVRDHYELFGLLFGLTATRAVERADGANLAEILAAAAAVGAASDPALFNAANQSLLRLLTQVAAAPRIASVARVMTSIVPGNFFLEVPGALAIQRRGIASIENALRVRDSVSAAAEFKTMLGLQGEAVIALLDERGIFSTPARPVDRGATS